MATTPRIITCLSCVLLALSQPNLDLCADNKIAHQSLTQLQDLADLTNKSFVQLTSLQQLNDSNSEVEEWSQFVERLNCEPLPNPFRPVDTLVRLYLPQGSGEAVLDIGCETGKNAVPLIEKGYSVILLDIAPNAIRYSMENLQQRGLFHGVIGCINGKIEELDPKYGPFKAVVGTFVFSFIPPHLFEKVMRNNVLGRIEPEGYFAGGFFGENHVWANDPNLSILTSETLEELFSSMGFSICEMQEKTEAHKTVLNGQQIFHTIEVIAKRNASNS